MEPVVALCLNPREWISLYGRKFWGNLCPETGLSPIDTSSERVCRLKDLLLN